MVDDLIPRNPTELELQMAEEILRLRAKIKRQKHKIKVLGILLEEWRLVGYSAQRTIRYIQNYTPGGRWNTTNTFPHHAQDLANTYITRDPDKERKQARRDALTSRPQPSGTTNNGGTI